MKKLIIFAMAALLPFLAQAQDVDRDEVFNLDPAITSMGYMYHMGDGLKELGIYDPDTGERLELTIMCSGGACTSTTSAFTWIGDTATNSEGDSAVINREEFSFYAIDMDDMFISTRGSQNQDPSVNHWNKNYPPITLFDGTVISFSVSFTKNNDANQIAQISVGGAGATPRNLCPDPRTETLQCGDTLDNGDAYEEPDPDQPWRNACYDSSQFCQTEPRLNCRFVQPSCCGA